MAIEWTRVPDRGRTPKHHVGIADDGSRFEIHYVRDEKGVILAYELRPFGGATSTHAIVGDAREAAEKMCGPSFRRSVWPRLPWVNYDDAVPAN